MNTTDITINENIHGTMNMIKLNIDAQKTVTGGSEPPMYLSPEAEARAKREKENLQRMMERERYVEISPGSDLLTYQEPSELDKHH